MTPYRRKSTIVDAEQWFPGKQVQAQGQIFCSDRWWFILSSGAALPLAPGDWLVQDPAGQAGYAPCPDAVFRASYEPLAENDDDDVAWDISLLA